jgi:hypothetical protein
LSKVADGKRTTGYADEDFIGSYMATAKKSEEEMKLLQEATSEKQIRLKHENALKTH